MKNKCFKRSHLLFPVVLPFILMVLFLRFYTSAFGYTSSVKPVIQERVKSSGKVSLSEIEEYKGIPFVLLNDNVPSFSEKDFVTSSYIAFSKLDSIGRTGTGMACLGKDTLPVEARGQIGDVRPSGWHTVRYDDLIEDRFLYNRCHVLGYQLSGDNATPENLFTGTRYLNIESMLFFENRVATYLRENDGNHVLYRVTPVYEEDNLVASGVQMEAYSVEDQGEGICFNAYVYNVQPGILINYANGESERDPHYKPDGVISAAAAYSMLTGTEVLRLEPVSSMSEEADVRTIPTEPVANEKETTYILNTNTKKFHYPECKSVDDMKEKNKKSFSGTREDAINAGYKPCKRCNP